MSKFYIFDRDDTLLNKKQELINPDFLICLFRTIDQHNLRWAVASAGGISWQDDPINSRLNPHINFKHEPVYVTLNKREKLLPHVIRCSGINDFMSDNTSEVETARLVLSALYDRKAQGLEYTQSKIEYTPPGRQNPVCSFSLSEEAKIRLRIGGTDYVINLKKYYEKINDIQDGDFKLFFILKALDKDLKKPELTEGLKAIGIEKISTPDNYTEINPADVVYVDDKIKNCDIVRSAGFTAIHADTDAAKRRYPGLKAMNTYMEEIKNTFTASMTDIFNQEEKRLTFINDIKKAINSYLEWMGDNCGGIRGLTRFSHWHHGESGKLRAMQLLDILNEPDSSHDYITQALQTVIENSSDTNHSLKTYLKRDGIIDENNQLTESLPQSRMGL